MCSLYIMYAFVTWQGQFFSKDHYCQYNMFNHYFFGNEDGKALYTKAIGEKNTIILVDPPFGGLCDILWHNISNINKEWQAIHKCEWVISWQLYRWTQCDRDVSLTRILCRIVILYYSIILFNVLLKTIPFALDFY